MSGSNYYILMGDVVKSTDSNQKNLATQLSELISETNSYTKDYTLSPYTITLGDEFQGVTKNLRSGIQTIFYLEEARLRSKFDFKLHYAFVKGGIETEINPEIAYGMMGEGLTRARNILTEKKRGRKRFQVAINNDLPADIENLFEVMDSITNLWKKKDYPLIYEMITNDNDASVGAKFNKDRSLIWRRRNTLMIKEYNLLKSFILDYIGDA